VASNRKRLQKQLTYRCKGSVNLAAHTAAWDGYTWQAGPVQVRCVGPWGAPWVLAASESVGKAVLRKAGALAGWDVDDPNQFEWVVATVGGGRIGRSGTMGLRRIRGLPCVSSRDGSSGAPNWDE
jgi:hypothetical protein